MRLPLHSDAARALAIAATAERASLHSISEGGEGDRGALHRSGEAAAHAPRAAQGGARSWRQLERGLIGGGFSWRLRSCVFSADGRRVAVASNAGVVFVFEAERGRLIGVACHPLASTNDAEVEARHVTVTTHPGGPPSDSRGVSCWLRRALARARMVASFPVSDRTHGGPLPQRPQGGPGGWPPSSSSPIPRRVTRRHTRRRRAAPSLTALTATSYCCHLPHHGHVLLLPPPSSRPRLTATSLITATSYCCHLPHHGHVLLPPPSSRPTGRPSLAPSLPRRTPPRSMRPSTRRSCPTRTPAGSPPTSPSSLRSRPRRLVRCSRSTTSSAMTMSAMASRRRERSKPSKRRG